MKKKVYNFINTNAIFVNLIYWLIILNVFAVILSSYKELNEAYGGFFYAFEFVSVVVFTIEYILRLWTCDLDPKFTGPKLVKRFKFAFSTYGLIDLIAILPFYLPLIFPFDMRMLRILRLFRLLRIFKLGRLSKSLKTITEVFRETRGELAITLFVTFILMVLSSTLMYYIEGEVQPDKFGNIGQSMWWAMATLTTVGYGDVYPMTGLGKIISGVIALVSIGFIALPTGIISSAFIEKIKTKNRELEKEACTCPNCGHIYKKES